MNFEENNLIPKIKSEEKLEKTGIHVGVRTNPDGTLDYSSSMELLATKDEKTKMDKSDQEYRFKKEKERKEKLAIPEEVKPGSADMVFYTMRNTITINQETLGKAEKNHTPEEYRLKALIPEQQKQQDLLRSILKENMSAMEAYEVIQQKIDKWEEMLVKNEHSVTDEEMKSAQALQSRLLAEASRDGQK